MSEGRQLARILSVFDLSMLASASMGPAYSIASTMGLMIASAGAATPVALLVLTCCMVCVAVSYAALSSRYPNAGSSYSWILQAFGSSTGAWGAWLLLMANIFAVLATAIPAATYTLDLVRPDLVASPLIVSATGAGWVIVSGILLALGMRPTAGVTAILLIGEIVVLAASALAAALRPAAQLAVIPVHAHAAPGLSVFGVMTAMVLAIWVVDGWELSAATSEEARHGRAPGQSGVLALVAVSVTVLIAVTAYMHFIAPPDFIAHQADAMDLVAQRLGSWWVPVIVITVLVSTSASLWTTILYLTRSLYAMGRDGVIPSWFSQLGADHTPRRALLLVTVVTSLLTLAGGASKSVGDALALALSGSGVFLGLIFVATALAALRLARQGRPWFLGVAVPLIGAVTIGVLSLGQLVEGDFKLRIFAVAAIILGVPFALWRGPKIKPAPTSAP